MKVVDLKLPENGLVLIDCKSKEILTTISVDKFNSGKARHAQRILITREDVKKWRHMILRKNEFVCSLKSLKDMIPMVAKCDDSNF
ncbi:hypothetical protein ACTEV4_001880 [Cronobacter turicensis]